VHPICDLQIEYSLISRGIEKNILPALRELGIGLTAYGVLSRGLISGHWSKARQGEQDFRCASPRFQGENLEKNLRLVDRLRAVAGAKGISVARLAIAWVLAQGDDIVALAAPDVELTAADLTGIADAVPPDAAAGARYGAQQMHSLDSERETSPSGF